MTKVQVFCPPANVEFSIHDIAIVILRGSIQLEKRFSEASVSIEVIASYHFSAVLKLQVFPPVYIFSIREIDILEKLST